MLIVASIPELSCRSEAFRLKAFLWKATSKAYAYESNFYRKQRYIQKIWGATAIGRTIRPRSGQLLTRYIFQALILVLSHI
jgi:hypothetical protein